MRPAVYCDFPQPSSHRCVSPAVKLPLKGLRFAEAPLVGRRCPPSQEATPPLRRPSKNPSPRRPKQPAQLQPWADTAASVNEQVTDSCIRFKFCAPIFHAALEPIGKIGRRNKALPPADDPAARATTGSPVRCAIEIGLFLQTVQCRTPLQTAMCVLRPGRAPQVSIDFAKRLCQLSRRSVTGTD